MENLQNKNALSTDNAPTSTNVPTSNTKPTSIITKFTTNNKSKQPQVPIGCYLVFPSVPIGCWLANTLPYCRSWNLQSSAGRESISAIWGELN